MNKAELVSRIAEKAEVSKKDAEACLGAFVEAVQEAVKAGDAVSLIGFGTFKETVRAARTGKNPRTGEKIEIPASKAPAFKPGKAFKDALNG